ncbi:MAG: 4-hydroxy-tetrahydrodipicolinate reductase [Bacteroidota bacterium]
MLKIALLGYGKMGKAIEQEATARGHEISFRIDQDNHKELSSITPSNTDAIIEFTHPDSFWRNLEACLTLGVPIISGTTGWYDERSKAYELVSEKNAAFMFGSNFSVGVNLFFKLNERLAELMNPYTDYDCYVEEQHHRYKADGPSGTAVTLAQQVLSRLDRKESIAPDLRTRPPQPEELSVGFIRSGEIIGRHRVGYTSDIDSLTIEHHAYNRRGFALGAVIAAEWMQGKKGFFEFKDVF